MADQTKRILYLQDNGVVAIVMPGVNETRSIDEIARQAVPTGKKYKIVEDSDMPSDWSFRDAWTVSESDLTDGEGTKELLL